MAPPDDVENSSTGQELLENLIKEGLTPSGHDNEPSRYRRLVQVLFQNCILKPIERNLPPNIQQCEYTITILKRQTAIHPNLLLDQIDGDIHIPFFQWLLPRLVYAALRLEDENLVDELISSAVNVIYALGKDMSDDDSTWAKGPKRVTVTLGYLNTFCQDLPNEPNTLLITLSIILSVRLPFTDTMTADACAKLSQASRLMRTTSLQARYTLYAASACSVTRPHELTKACLFVANLSIVEDANLQKAIIIFYDRLAQSDEVLRCEVWWSLYRRIDTLRMSNEVDFSCALFLLAPIPPRLSSGTIRHLIHSEILVRWKDELAHNPSRLDRLEDLIGGIRIENPRKRKRSEEEAEALAIITEVIPDFAMEGDVVESLRNSRLSESFLDVWIQIGQADLAALQSLARILDHTPLRTIAVGTQLSSRQGIIKLVFQGLKASERSVRVAAGHHNKTPYTLISPFLEDISVLLAENLARSPDMIAETMQFIGFTRQNFLSTTLQYTLPALVLTRNREALQHVASIVKERLGVLLMDNIANILARVFLHPQQTDNSLKFLVTLIQNMTSGNPKAQPVISAASLMTACIVDFVVMLVVELGDEERSVRESAKTALEKAQAQQDGRNSDLGAFLKPLMLGVISQLNDMLHDVLGKKTVEFKRKIIRSLGALIRFVGDSMASFSPQSTLGISELRQETLRTWSLFISTLRYADVGPFVGRTTGALVANWPTFDAVERTIAIQIIDEIAGNVKHLSQFVEEVVGMDNIPELRSAAARLTAHRKNWPLRLHISKVLDRVNSKNIAIATASLNELKLLIAKNEEELHMLVRGDTFDSIAARVMSSLLSTATRDGDCQELRDLSYECMGMLGALDPDRLGLRAESGTITLTSNFTDQEESFDFALHLVRDLLVDAFRATNDTKHQTHLAYAIQELLKFCGFTPKILHPGNKVHAGTLTRWQSLPKDQLETLTPLLESRFSISDATVKSFPHPIYSNSPTYREWLQRWATDLVGKVMSMPGHDRPVRDSKMIFGVFRGILRNQDVTVAHHILPHLVLSVLLSGDASYRDEICLEINAVLQDQVNPTGSADKRNLSAQVIFDLMDHLSKWLRLNRVAKSDRTDITRIVEGVLSSIETELMANAALQSRAYARSLRSFEQRIVQLRREKRENTELQTYFERLHQIYSELDEPDGMEGVSAFVISPSLEHQIREHESTGRWTSAQSCWEVRLQQSPDDVSLHVGLLKCLRNLGHYAAWIIGDWDTVKQIGSEGPPVGHALLALHENQDLAPVLTQVRRDLGVGITGKQYGHAYEPLLQLHLVHEIAMIHKAKQSIEITPKSNNRNVIIQQHVRSLTKSFKSRFLSTSPAFRVREAILSIRRTAYSVVNTPLLNPEIGDAWILSSKIARKSGYEQTAYSATLQAKEAEAPFAFVQQAKLLRVHGSVFKALTDLQNTLIPLLGADPARKDGSVIDLTRDDDFARDRNLAKVSDYFLESPYYHLGHYYDSMTGSPEQIHDAMGAQLTKITNLVDRSRKTLPPYQANDNGVAMMVKDANVLSSALLKFTDDQVEDKRKEFSLKDRFPYLSPSELKRTRMILPLQDALTCSLPTTSETIKSHNPFPTAPVEIAGGFTFLPKKLVFIGTDGKNYPFLCKPHDDLRKDARLMDLNSMINKLLKSASESRRRQLYIRTYAVMPLNEECGLLEWVTNTYALKSILEKGYARYGKKIYNSEVLTNVFTSTILPRYTPTVFHEWFLTTWPEPSAWLASRLAYGRTLAVMLGDRHGENILFDGLSGDTVHVDLNCLFDKGKTFDIPERVPFRLTHNMVDALGVTGVEGVFRKAAEITMSILRSNSDSLMSVLEAFVHDPLVEWTKPGRSKSERDIRSSADRNLRPIKAKLRGIMEEGTIVSVPSQVEALIKQATSPSFLAAMYVGWAPWL
ncbi:hypothetical protein CI109_103565 [Kwoniella shandongensis]|uniref:non-specific serine/threonine protein kinase n=1 Tax=Kwoniella shandongensis TaxID=1734106 RepID=A0AAJ8MXL2_9TREE